MDMTWQFPKEEIQMANTKERCSTNPLAMIL